MIRSYYKKHDLTQTQLKAYGMRAESQEQEILTFLKGVGDPFFFTCETLERYGLLGPGTPHSSYIRAIANLRKRGEIVKVDQVMGRYRRPVNLYCLKTHMAEAIEEVDEQW